ncbi:MAG: poly(A) polymerase [Deltaproteobacteria bacterium]|nr:poly(A) polymerase [Deltaproteobacteria bacterium]
MLSAEPRLIPRPDHPISRANIDVEVLKVLYRLHHRGYKAYLVGGSVRDLWLGKKPKDFDIATDAQPQDIRRLFRNSRIIGKRFRLVQVFFKGGKIVEVSTFRSRSEFDSDGEVLAPNNTFGSPAEDAWRRDLTINGLFYDIADFSLIDYVGGLADLENRVIRVIGPPEVRFRRDPVRMLRVLRHAARTDFRIDAASWQGVKSHRQLIRLCSPARVRDELLKDFKSGFCGDFMLLMVDSGLLPAILPHFEEFLQDATAVEAVKNRLREIYKIVDLLSRTNLPFSEAFFWAGFLIPFLETAQGVAFQEIKPEAVEPFVHDSLAILDFAKGRREEVILLWLTAAHLLRLLSAGQRLPARLKRRTCLPEAWLLQQILAGASPELVEEITLRAGIVPSLPDTPPKKKGRRGRQGRPRKKIFPV